jgi:hypothetical protein
LTRAGTFGNLNLILNLDFGPRGRHSAGGLRKLFFGLTKVDMQKILVAFIFGVATVAAADMNNADIIKMIKTGLGESVILQVIKANPGSYNTSADAVIALKSAGVPDNVIAAMLSRNSGGPQTAAPPLSPLLAEYAARSGGARLAFDISVSSNGKQAATLTAEPVQINMSSSKQRSLIKPSLLGSRHLPGQDRTVAGETASIKVAQSDSLVFTASPQVLANARLVRTKPKDGARFVYETQDGQSVAKAEYVEATISTSGDGVITLRPKEPLVPGGYAIIPTQAYRVFTFEVVARPLN